MNLRKKGFFLLGLIIILFYPYVLKAETWVISSYPLYKIISGIFPEKNLYLIQSPKGDFHFFEPLPKDWERIKKAQLVFILGTEPFARKIYQLVPQERIFSLKDRKETLPDPHLWFDLKRLKVKLEDLLKREELKKDPNYVRWKERVQKFLKELAEVEREYAQLSKCKGKELYVLGHRVFYYLLKNTGISEKSLIAGHHHGEVTPKRLKDFLSEAKRKGIKGVALTEWEYFKYSQIFEKEGLKVYKVLTGDQDFEGDFLFLLKHNLQIIKDLLNC